MSSYSLGDHLRYKVYDNQIPARFVIDKIDKQKNIYTLRNLFTNQTIFEPRENLDILYIKEK